MVRFSKPEPSSQESTPPQTDQSELPAPDTPLGLNVYHALSEPDPEESADKD